MPYQLGDLQIERVSGGRMRSDGGNMFGVVPKVLWQKRAQPDESNRIALDNNCLLVRTEGELVLIDTGVGEKASARKRQQFAYEEGNPLLRNLAAVGVDRADIDLVLLTHLHPDHAGGATVPGDGGTLEPTFPQARYVVQQREWEDATAQRPELAGAYFEDDFLPFARRDQLRLIDGEMEVAPHVRCQLTGGHTRGHQVVVLGAAPDAAIYLGDVCPTAAHLQALWTTAYEQFPLDLRRTKPRILGEAADTRQLVIFAHDAQLRAAYLERHPRQQFVVGQEITL